MTFLSVKVFEIDALTRRNPKHYEVGHCHMIQEVERGRVTPYNAACKSLNLITDNSSLFH